MAADTPRPLLDATRTIGYRAVVGAPLLRFVEELRDAILAALRSSDVAPRLHYVHGPQSVGKSALLRALPDAPTPDGHQLRFVLVSAPPGAPDAAAAAASRLAGELHRVGALREPELADFESPGTSWPDKLELLRNVFNDEEHTADLVLLIDEPSTWRSSVGGPFTEHAEQLSRLLVDGVRTRRVVTTRRAPERSAHHRLYALQAGGDHAEWLAQSDYWGPLAPAALALARTDPEGLDVFTPMQVRLGVTLGHLGQADVVDVVLHSSHRALIELCEAVVRTLGPQGGALVETLAQLCLVRGPFDDRLLETLGAPDAGTEEGKLLRSGLLYGREGHYVLHDALRGVLRQRLSSHDPAVREACHQRYVDYYSLVREAAHTQHDVTARLSAEVEVFWHACHAGVTDADHRYVHRFPIQPLLYGTSMHLLHHRPEVAKRVFAEQVESTGSAYAIHQLAFVCDSLAVNPDSVERGYRQALELDDSIARWHARLITFLLDQGAPGEAKVAWQEALRAPLSSNERAESTVSQLHRPVLARLLRIGEVAFAQEVLDSLDPDEIDADPALRAFRTRLAALIEAERVGPVRPYALLQPGWWRDEPRHLLARMPEQLTLAHWWAARVAGVGEEGVELQFAEIADGTVRPGNTHVARATFADALSDVTPDDLRRGEFLEIGFYRNGSPDIAQVVVQRVRVEGTLGDVPAPELPPQRYHAAAGRIEA
jgi:hypothetical protein